ncbi:FAD-binding domain-containing protein [Xylariaceae sp. FL0016]|nr:FAD-binding domain-containing protein [Xylariaceae sp. FL0016]
MAAGSIQSALPASCKVSTPTSDDTVYTFLSKRWSTLGDSKLPFAAVVPGTEDDVVAVVRYAATHGLKVLPQCGACGGVVVTMSKTLYVDMEKFRSVQVDADAQAVTFGGGALTWDVLPAVTGRGFYTAWPNIGAVGLVGNILGGGINLVQGIRGHTCDNLISARMVTASGEVVEVSSSSTGREKELFNVLKGAGAGFGVILSLTCRIYPMSELDLEDGTKISEIDAMFTQENFDAAGEQWEKFQGYQGKAALNFVLMTGPPNCPTPGKPVIVFGGSFAGPASEAEKAFAPLQDPRIKNKAAFAMPKLTEFGKMNDRRDMMMRKGAHLDCFNGLMKNLSKKSFLRAADRFAELLDKHGADIGAKMTVFYHMHSETLTRVEGGSDGFMCYRDRDYMQQTVPWNVADGFTGVVRQYGADILEIARSEDQADGLPNGILAGNARVEADMAEVLSTEKLEVVRNMKQQWDPNGVFWSAAMDGWAC